ncbi:putative secreted protein (Por secretion system target) [Arcicella aurantiaca]|uniref:Putative secreted protein (Por secretion system target) n=1 Tax=Arcicella aurantiaca TaxID=591202 RepID=A0A316EDH5_9BACT|nr:S8 family serine peptidase [Arcicella aurantiaca]PWK28983.1 putative secreted protein (Por secretion system target) [Arcicella aurantiaca]
MNIFPPEDCSWIKDSFRGKVVILASFLVLINLFNLVAQSSDEINSSEKSAIVSSEKNSEKALRKLTKVLKSDAKSNFKKTLQLANINNWTLQKTLPDGRTMALQGIDETENPIYYITHGQVSPSACTRTNSLYAGGSLGVSLSGASSVVRNKLGLWDGGLVRSTHQELGVSRITQIDAPPYLNEHATHLAGILIGTGVNKQARGMAYGGSLKVWDFGDDVSEMAFAAKSLLVSNHSYGVLAGWVFNPDRSGIIFRDDNLKWEWWGDTTISKTEDYRFGFYDKKSSDIDKIAYNAPYYLIVKSADNKRTETGPPAGTPYYFRNTNTKSTISRSRNDSFDTIPMDGNAKNIITVGAIDGGDVVPTKPSDIKMSAYSSWGPTDDGRIKPDIVGTGDGILSASSNGDDAYTTLSGTSVAAPNIAGSLLLLQEFYARKNYGFTMRSSTLKGLVLHTANEAGTTQGPDYQFGWGLLNTERAAQVIDNKDQNHFISESLLYQNSINTIQVVASGKSPITATICWTDPEATPTEAKAENLNSRKPKLINDLDIRISDGTNTYYPWVLNPDAPSQGATQGDNFRDNIEQIYIEKPVYGKTYTITVRHKGSVLKGDIQYYAMIVSGVSSTPCQLSASIASAGNTSLCKGAVKLLTNSGTNLSYVWSWNGQQIPLSNANSYHVKFAGNYTVTVTQGKCSSTSPIITVENAQTPTVSSDNGSNICAGNVNLSVKNLTGTGITYQWLKDNSNISKATNSTLAVTATGNYSVKTTQNGCSATSLPFVITSMGNSISTKPSTGKYLLINGRSTTIQTVLTDNLPYTFQWFKDGVKIQNATQSSISINQAGKYTVQMTLGKCTSTSGVVEFVKVSNARVMSFDDFMQDVEPETLIISPNPTNEWLKIQYLSKQNIPTEPSVEIINALGLNVLSDKLEKLQDNTFTKEINVKSLSTGMYFVRIIDGEQVLVKKFIRGE